MIPGVPYDAEIEYLESTGTQYIDALVTISSNSYARFVVDCTITNTLPNSSIFAGSGVAAVGGLHYVMELYGGSYYIRTGGGTTTNHIPYVHGTRVIIDTYYDSQHRRVVKIGDRIYQGTAYNTESGTLLLLLGTSNATWQKQTGRLFSAKIYDGEDILRDFIPVRVGQTGYMYDRVTRRLFGNNGTGSFVLGPDVAKPVMGLWRMRKVYTADDYIKDGLVAMWDGIENAGWGVHDFTATVWKDLVGGISPTCSGSPTWTSDAYDFNASTYFTSSSTLPASIILSGNYTLEIALSSKSSGDGNGGIIGIGTSNRTFWIWERSPSYSYSYLIDAIQTAQGTWNNSTNWGFNKQYVFQFSVSPTGAFFDVNGSRFQTKASTSTASQSAGGFYLGRIHGYYVCRSAVHCYRLYSRALSSAEIAHNYQIDKARFNLT